MKSYFKEVDNTLKAGWFELTMADLFGKKIIENDGEYATTLHRWRGKTYFTTFKKIKKGPLR